MVLLGLLGQKYEEGGPNTEHYRDGMMLYANKVVDSKDGYQPWWSNDSGTHNLAPLSEELNMPYECDAGLGTPNATDCSHLEYSELGAPSDNVVISPDTPKILSSSNYIDKPSVLQS